MAIFKCDDCGATSKFFVDPPELYCLFCLDNSEQLSTVDHPAHYNSHPSGVECIEIIEHFSYNVGAAIKHLWRHGLKGDALEDLKKARWYIEREIERLSK